jgi:outer membrane protein OmpA-like peptidoglycan-associated protein
MPMSKVFGKRSKSAVHDEDHWISVSDLMAGLMMVFMFISISLMRDAMIERDKIKEVAVTYQENQEAIYNALLDEFKTDMDEWGAEIDQNTLSFNFNSPEVLFSLGRSDIKPAFKHILNDFLPRYLATLDKFKDNIDEVRIEGHTSSRWNHDSSENEAYFKNMKLSQGRTRAVLAYSNSIDSTLPYRDWMRRYIAAVGFSSSKLILNKNGTENSQKSQRVSFRVITNAETQIRKILGS